MTVDQRRWNREGSGSGGRTTHQTNPRSRVTLSLVSLLLSICGGCANSETRPDPESNSEETEVTATEDASGADVVDIEPTVVEYTDYNDPLIGVNRAVFAFNDVTYRYILIPASNGYVAVVPAPARQSVSNFFYNLKTPIYLVGNLLQLDFGAAGDNLVRFGMNTTTGVLGLFDTADAWLGIERAEAHLEDALISYGAGYGMYIVIPLLGPSDLRNAPSELTDMVLNPVFHLTGNPERLMIQSFDYLQENAAGADRYNTLREKSEDPYIYFRNMYLQGVQRDADYQ